MSFFSPWGKTIYVYSSGRVISGVATDPRTQAPTPQQYTNHILHLHLLCFRTTVPPCDLNWVMPSPVKAKGQYSTVPSDVSSPPFPQPPPIAGSGYFTPETESTTSMLRASESRQQSPAPESISETTFSPSPRPKRPVAVSFGAVVLPLCVLLTSSF
jgi:hypothetical protein